MVRQQKVKSAQMLFSSALVWVGIPQEALCVLQRSHTFSEEKGKSFSLF